MGFTIAVRNAILEAEFAGTRYLGLSTVDPGSDGAAVAEPVGGDYARVAIATGDWAAAALGVKATAADVTFPAPTGDWGTITHIVEFDAATDGNVRASTPLPVAKTVSSGADAPVFYAGNITFTLT